MGIRQSIEYDTNTYGRYEGNFLVKDYLEKIGENNYMYVNSYTGSGKCMLCDKGLKNKETLIMMCRKNHTYHIDCVMSNLYKINCVECKHIM